MTDTATLPVIRLGIAGRATDDNLKIRLTTDDGKEREFGMSLGAAASLAGHITRALVTAPPTPKVDVREVVDNLMGASAAAQVPRSKLMKARDAFKTHWLDESDGTGERIRKWSICALEGNLTREDFIDGLWLVVARDR